MQKYFQIGQVIISVLLIAAILLQGRGVGLGAAFGGGGDFYRTKRGLEKTIFIVTVILAIFFLTLGVINILLTA